MFENLKPFGNDSLFPMEQPNALSLWVSLKRNLEIPVARCVLQNRCSCANQSVPVSIDGHDPPLKKTVFRGGGVSDRFTT